MFSVRVLGDLEITRDRRPIELAPVNAQTLIPILLSGPAGITADDLKKALSDVGRSETAGALHRRLSDLRKTIPITKLNEARRYRLEPGCLATVDAMEFVDGVATLAKQPDPALADQLMRLWRGNPLAGLGKRAREVWRPVIDAHERLVELLSGWPAERLGRLTALRGYAALFSDDWRLQRLSKGPSGKPRLLVLEDQVMTEIQRLLEDEFEIVPAISYEQWCELRDSGVLDTVDAALIDRHLERSDSLGTTKVATYLQMYTDIPATLMSVDVDCSAHKQLELCRKYRLFDVIRKDANGRINESGLVDAARAMTDTSPKAWRRRMHGWVESVACLVRDQSLGENPRVLDCLNERDRVIALLERGPQEQAEAAVTDFRRRWDPSAGAARP